MPFICGIGLEAALDRLWRFLESCLYGGGLASKSPFLGHLVLSEFCCSVSECCFPSSLGQLPSHILLAKLHPRSSQLHQLHHVPSQLQQTMTALSPSPCCLSLNTIERSSRPWRPARVTLVGAPAGGVLRSRAESEGVHVRSEIGDPDRGTGEIDWGRRGFFLCRCRD